MMRRTVSAWGKKAAVAAGEADIVIVGGGTSGCLIAGELAMAGLKTVLVEEGEDIASTDKTDLSHSSFRSDWKFKLPSAQHYFRMQQAGYEKHYSIPKQIDYRSNNSNTPSTDGDASSSSSPTSVYDPKVTVAKVLGGSGVMGRRSWILGNRADWENNMGGVGWHDLLGYVQKFEDVEKIEAHRGKRGNFVLSRPMSMSPLYKLVNEALFKNKVQLVAELNSPSYQLRMGSSRPEVAISNMDYSSQNTLGNTNFRNALSTLRALSVRSNTRAVSLVASSTERDAVKSVRTKNTVTGEEEEIEAPMVILCAGSVGSPQLIADSFSAAQKTRKEGDIDISGVGANFWDCPTVLLQYEVIADQIRTHQCLAEPFAQWIAKEGWKRTTSANLITSAFDDLVVFWSSTDDVQNPDVRITVQPFAFNPVTGEVPSSVRNAYQFQIQLARPKSRGSITGATDGGSVIDPKYFSHPEDLATMQKAVAFIKESVAKTAPLSTVTKGLIGEQLISTGISGGGCALGSCVEPDTGKLKGAKNLFICDQSVIPSPAAGDLTPYVCGLGLRFSQKFLQKPGITKMSETGARIIF